jgi:hypothetical protein
MKCLVISRQLTNHDPVVSTVKVFGDRVCNMNERTALYFVAQEKKRICSQFVEFKTATWTHQFIECEIISADEL